MLLCIHFLCFLQYITPAVTATTTTTPMVAMTPIRTTGQRSSQLCISCRNYFSFDILYHQNKGISRDNQLGQVPIKVVLFPCWLLPSLPVVVVETAVVGLEVEPVEAEAAAVEYVLSSEHTIVERHYSLILGLQVKAKRELTNYNCFNGRSSCGIFCTYPWKNGTPINIWGWTDDKVSLMMSGWFTFTHQSDEKELRHSTWAYNTHLHIYRR